MAVKRFNFCIFLLRRIEWSCSLLKSGGGKKLRGVKNGLAIVLELAGIHDPDPGAEI